MSGIRLPTGMPSGKEFERLPEGWEEALPVAFDNRASGANLMHLGDPLTLNAISAIASVLTALLTAGIVWYAARQIYSARTSLKAALINSLESEFKELYPTYQNLLPGRSWSNDGHPGPQSDNDLCMITAPEEWPGLPVSPEGGTSAKSHT